MAHGRDEEPSGDHPPRAGHHVEVAQKAFKLGHPEVCVAVQLAEKHTILHSVCDSQRGEVLSPERQIS